jgi:uncharacterized protein YcbX
MATTGRDVGRVVGLWRYPVKSMAAEPLSQAHVSWHGLAGDRRFAFVRDGVAQSGFPWLTIRQREEMRQHSPSFVSPDDPDASAVTVRTPAGASYDVLDPALAALLGAGVRVIKQDRGVFDTFPLSLITTQSIASLGALVGAPLVAQRFRPNLLVETNGGAPFPEDEWLGRVLRVGAMRMRVDKRDGRCVIVTIDPETNERNPEVLKAIARERQNCMGVYGTTVEPGRVAVGDGVALEE